MTVPKLPQLIYSFHNNTTFRNGALFSLFSFVNRGFSFLLMLVLANYITPAEYGYLSLFGTVVMVVGYFISMSSDGYLSVTFFLDGKEGVKNCFSSILYTTIIVSVVSFLVIFLAGDRLSEALEFPKYSLYLAVVICFFTVYTNLNLDLFRLQERVKIYGFFTLTNALLNFILSIILVKHFLLGWEGRVYAQVLCFTIFGLIGIYYFARRGSIGKPNWEYWGAMLAWGIPMIPHVATNFIRQGCDRYIINYYHSIDDVGLFSFALTIANILLIVGIGFNQSNSVDIYKVLGENSLNGKQKSFKLKKQNRIIFIIYFISFVLVLVGACLMLPLLLPEYTGCVKYIPLLTISMFFNCCYFLYTNFLFYYKKTKWIMYTTVSCSIIHLGLSFALTRYSLMLTAGVYCISQLLIMLIIMILAKRIVKERLGVSI